eukprot:scaffold13396_cov95-Isochrysis_galbana.AAC.4
MSAVALYDSRHPGSAEKPPDVGTGMRAPKLRGGALNRTRSRLPPKRDAASTNRSPAHGSRVCRIESPSVLRKSQRSGVAGELFVDRASRSNPAAPPVSSVGLEPELPPEP